MNLDRGLSLAFWGMFGAASGQLIEDHTLSLQTLLAITGVVLPATWWLSKKFTHIMDEITYIQNQIANLPCKDNKPNNEQELCGNGEE